MCINSYPDNTLDKLFTKKFTKKFAKTEFTELFTKKVSYKMEAQLESTTTSVTLSSSDILADIRSYFPCDSVCSTYEAEEVDEEDDDFAAFLNCSWADEDDYDDDENFETRSCTF